MLLIIKKKKKEKKKGIWHARKHAQQKTALEKGMVKLGKAPNNADLT